LFRLLLRLANIILRFAKSLLSSTDDGLIFFGLRNAPEIQVNELPAAELDFSLLVYKIELLKTSCQAFLDAVSGNLKSKIRLK